MRLGPTESQTIGVLVVDPKTGKSQMEQITVTYEDANQYVKDYRDAGIEYLTGIVEDKQNVRLEVWVSGETVLYLPPPLTNLDALHSMMVAQT